MSLNIKNPRTHELVRELARRTGQSQTSAVEDAVVRRLAELGPESEPMDRISRARAIVDAYQQSLSAADRVRLQAADHELYDDAGLPR